jgi:hypothetical protein
MRQLRRRDIPAGAAIAITALVMVANAVTGDEKPRGDTTAAAESTKEAPRPGTAEDLDIERLKRPRQETPPPDLFAPRPPVKPVAVAAAPTAPPTPTAPPLPFKYLGRLVDDGKVMVFLEGSQRSIAASAGETLDGTYLLESIGDSVVQFVYLPLGTRQTLAIPAQY